MSSIAKEIWFTPGDYSPSYRLRVIGDEVELLFVQDIWPGYPGAKVLPTVQAHHDFLRRPENKARILDIAARTNVRVE